MKSWRSVLLSVTSLLVVTFVSIATLVQANVMGLNAAASPVFATASSSVKTATDTGYEEAINILKDKGIALSTTPSVVIERVTHTSPVHDDVDLLRGTAMLLEEFLKYSSHTIKATGLKKIYLVKNLSVSGQLRAGMPDPILEDALYFDISSLYINSEDGAYLRRTFHHEFKHLIDYNLYGSYRGGTSDWTSCNPIDSRYGKGGSAMYGDPDYAHAVHPKTGYVNGYATSGIEEDRAEVYALLMTKPEELQSLSDKDSSIFCKVAITQQLQRQL